MKGKSHSKPAAGFTLAELLMAIAIIGILFVIALPVLTNISGLSKLDAAANSVHSATQLARQFAITENQPTYLVLNEGQIDSNLAFRAFAVFTINIHTNVTPIPQEAGYYLKKWERLPEGVVFDDQSSFSNNLFAVDYSDKWNGAFNEQNELKIQDNTYVVVGFSPTGQSATSLNHKRRLLIAEEFYNPAGGRLGKEIQMDLQGRGFVTDIIYDENGKPRGVANEPHAHY